VRLFVAIVIAILLGCAALASHSKKPFDLRIDAGDVR
jgi:hypothetical protein